MERVALGVATERELITHFKVAALEAALLEAKTGSGLPLATSPVQSLRELRRHASELRALTLEHLRRAAEEAARAERQEDSEEEKKKARRARRAPRGAGQGASIDARLKGGGSKRGSLAKRRTSRYSMESLSRSFSPVGTPSTTPATARAMADGAAALAAARALTPGRGAAGALPTLSLTARARIGDGDGDGGGERLSANYPVCLPMLQPSSRASGRMDAYMVQASPCLMNVGAGGSSASVMMAVSSAAEAATFETLVSASHGAAPPPSGQQIHPPAAVAGGPDDAAPRALNPLAAAGAGAEAHTPRPPPVPPSEPSPRRAPREPRPSGGGAEAAHGTAVFGRPPPRLHVSKSKAPARVWAEVGS